MNGWMERPLMLVALGLGLVLVTLGLGKRLGPLLMGKRGAFWATLALFVVSGGCELGGVGAQNRGQGVAAGVAAGEALELPPELAAQGKWEAFRQAWKKIGQAQPKGAAGNRGDRAFGGAVTHEKRQELVEQVAKAVGCTASELHQLGPAGLDLSAEPKGTCALSLPTRVLVEAAMARIWALGPDTSMMMHMLPPPDLIYRNRLKAQLQKRFELLATRRLEGKLTEEEFQDGVKGLEAQLFHLAIVRVATQGPTVVVSLPLTGGKGAPDDPYVVAEVPQDGSNAAFEKEAEEWMTNARTWCADEQARLKAGQGTPDSLKTVEHSCARLTAAFDALKQARPNVRRLMEALEKE